MQENEITLKEVILKLIEWFHYLRSKWLIIVLCGILGAFIGFFYAYRIKPDYVATLTFALEDEKGGGGSSLGGALGLASQFGFDLGGSSSGGIFDGGNLMELMKSRRLVEKTLLNPIHYNGKDISLMEYYADFTGLRENWDKRNDLKRIVFLPDADRSKFTLQQDSILGTVYGGIIGKGLMVYQKDKKVSIISIDVRSKNELFSKVFAEELAKEVSDFYIETKSKRAKTNMLILQKQTDSVREELNNAISGVAVANDINFNLNSALNIKRVPSSKRQIDVQANTAILTQLVQNLELAKVSFRKETPLIQIIDKPILPLPKEKPSKLQYLIIGGIIGGIVILALLISRRLWKIIMK